MGSNIATMTFILCAAAQNSETSAGLDANAIVSIVGAVVSLLCAAISYFIGTKKMYVDIVIKDRLQAVEERRAALKDLYYYTDPKTIDLAISNDEKNSHIQSLLKIQSTIEHRLIEKLYPEKDLLNSTRQLIHLSVQYVQSGIKDQYYNKTRSNCLELLKIYNFASWNFAQKHATGRKGSSINGFDAAFVETLKSLTQESGTKYKMKNLLELHGVHVIAEKQEETEE